MQMFSREQIDRLRDTFRERGYEEVACRLGDQEFSYFVLPQELNPELQMFALRRTGEPEDGYVLGAADSVPAKFRRYWAGHEYMEFVVYGHEEEGVCRDAEEFVVDFVPPEDREEFASLRAVFFSRLMEYSAGRRTPEKEIAEYMQTLEFLESLIQPLEP